MSESDMVMRCLWVRVIRWQDVYEWKWLGDEISMNEWYGDEMFMSESDMAMRCLW
jgi:hypothetical protein